MAKLAKACQLQN
jgi:hypothetical protein